MELCEVCNENECTQLCDYAVGTGIITSIDFQEMTETCDKKLCKGCAVTLWANCDICPEHAMRVRSRILEVVRDEVI